MKQAWTSLRRTLHDRLSPVGEGPGLILLGAFVGLLAGGGALLFHYLVALLHNLFFQGSWSFYYNEHLPSTPSLWGPWVILVPVLGAFLVTILVQRVTTEVEGAGVSQVMESVHTDGGRIRPIIAVLRPLATALTLGSGGSAGREGPAMQFGAAMGALMGHVLPMSDSRRIHLVGCGVGAGIAAVFNAPLGGWFFAMEVIVPDWRPWTVLSTLVATVSATWITETGLGNFHILAYVPTPTLSGSLMLPAFALLGIVAGLMSFLFIQLLTWTGQTSKHYLPNPYLRHMSAMLLVGLLLYGMFWFTGHYYLIGGSYFAISEILTGHLHLLGFLILLLILKGVATSLTIGTGGSGGIFSPSLFMGAAMGAGVGYLAEGLLGWHGSIPLFAMCGMAGMVGASTGALISAPVMVVELTNNYHILLPAMVTSLTAFALRRVFLEQSIYTYPLFKKGLDIPENHYVVQEKIHPDKSSNK
ncbi:chloride channel protein [Acidithiobacillus thiooxidans]|uniref:chloride channel protein n=1 Tax=Acidithiobacillus thiooxidans TaxID=930 RepID=UPI002864198A|nr:chloride channel protein [Acidithiobacillus thiooxidans]MDR7926663.1 chloride channel protein [Acidithiobacillus thiooxidans]